MAGTSIKTLPIRQLQNVDQLLINDNARQQLSMVAAKHLNPERMMRVVANAIRTTPKLRQCEPLSFLGALMQCSSLGLEPNTILGHAYLVPFDKNVKGPDGRWQKIPQVQLIVGYKGLIDLARRSGHITSLSANIHYSDDELWEYEEGTEARLRHRPGNMEGQKLHAYAIAKFKDGGHAYVVLPWAHVMKIRDGAQGWQSAVKMGKTEDSPWAKHEDEMAKKTAIRALSKYLPLSVEFMDAMAVDEVGADYRGFAMDPSGGVAQTDGDYIDGEAEDGDADPETDQSKPDQEKAGRQEAEKPKETAKAEAKPAEQAKPDQEKSQPYDTRPSRTKKQEASSGDQLPLDQPSPQMTAANRMADQIIGEINDGVHPDEVYDLFRDQIANLEANPEMSPVLERINAAFDQAGN
ncbi:recombinase RecT [Roseicitreum antarcticum]|nr:recombinase RecT [Roseicitreum antarcticum]